MLKSKVIKMCTGVVALGLLFSVSTSMKANAAITNGDKFLGNIIAGSVPSNFSNYWNQVTPENATKWGAVEGARGKMNWGNADTIYNYAKSKGMPFKFHTLVWGSQEPSWVSGLSASDQKKEVTEWIQAAGQKYSSAKYVDVVNEPLHAKPSYRNAIGGDGSTGWDWVVWSFEQARKVFPNSKLLINEYGIIGDTNAANNYVKIINILKNKGLIDGIGIQCHQFNMDTVSVSTMKNVLNTLSATGLPIYVSELDITGNDSTQLARYKEKFPVLWENPNVKGITLWGYTQGQTWIDNTHLVTSSGSERPALTWLKSYLAGQSTTPTTPTNPTTGTLTECENMTLSGSYAGKITSPFNGVALYANNDSCSYNQYFANSTHSFSLKGCSNNASAAKVDLQIGGKTVGSFYFTGTTPTVQTISNVSHATGNQEVKLVVTSDNGSWDAYVDNLNIN